MRWAGAGSSRRCSIFGGWASRCFERRWRTPELRGDLDLVAWEDGQLCFVEVKTRTARDLAAAAVSVDDGKRRMLRSMARAYRRTLPRAQAEEWTARFDVVSVYLLGERVECELVRGAFPWSNSREDEDEFRRYGV